MSGIRDGLELEDEDLHHSHEDIAAGRLLLGFLSDTLDQVEEWLAGHGLDGDGQGGVVDVPGEQVHGQREVGEGEVCADMVDEVGENAVRQGPGETGQ